MVYGGGYFKLSLDFPAIINKNKKVRRVALWPKHRQLRRLKKRM